MQPNRYVMENKTIKVQMRDSVGHRLGTFQRGQVYDLPSSLVEEFSRAGFCELVPQNTKPDKRKYTRTAEGQ